MSPKLDSDWKDIDAVPSTLKQHRIVTVSPYVIDMQRNVTSSIIVRHHFKDYDEGLNVNKGQVIKDMANDTTNNLILSMK